MNKLGKLIKNNKVKSISKQFEEYSNNNFNKYIENVYNTYIFKDETTKLLYISELITRSYNKNICHKFFISNCLGVVEDQYDLCKKCIKNNMITEIINDYDFYIKYTKYHDTKYHKQCDNLEQVIYDLVDYKKDFEQTFDDIYEIYSTL